MGARTAQRRPSRACVWGLGSGLRIDGEHNNGNVLNGKRGRLLCVLRSFAGRRAAGRNFGGVGAECARVPAGKAGAEECERGKAAGRRYIMTIQI